MARYPGREKRNYPRINIAFYDDHLEFLRYASWKNHMSITQFVNSLIAREKGAYDRAEWAPEEETKGPSLDALVAAAEQKRDSNLGVSSHQPFRSAEAER